MVKKSLIVGFNDLTASKKGIKEWRRVELYIRRTHSNFLDVGETKVALSLETMKAWDWGIFLIICTVTYCNVVHILKAENP